jgi:hypothetical protein
MGSRSFSLLNKRVRKSNTSAVVVLNKHAVGSFPTYCTLGQYSDGSRIHSAQCTIMEELVRKEKTSISELFPLRLISWGRSSAREL